MGVGGGGDCCAACKTSTPAGLVWLLARIAVAVAVTAVAAFVLVVGLRLLLPVGPDTKIEFDIAQSDLFVQRNETSHHTVYYGLRFYLEVSNPSDVLFIGYRDITVKLYDSDPLTYPATATELAEFKLYPADLFVSPKEEQEYFVFAYVCDRNATATDCNPTGVNGFEKLEKLFKQNRSQIGGAVMALSGVRSLRNMQRGLSSDGIHANYYCKPVTIRNGFTLAKPSSENFKTKCLTDK